MKSLILVLLVCVSLTQAFNPFGMFKKWKGEVEEAIDSSDHQEHAQRFLDEVRKTSAHFENSEHNRNKVGKVWMKFKNKTEETLEKAKDTIDEVEEELNSNEEVPDRARKIMKEIRHQTRGIVKSLKKIIHPIKFSRGQTEEPEVLPTELPEPEVLPTELPEPEVLPTELPEPELYSKLPEPEVLPTELPEPEVFPTEPEPEILSTEPEVLPTEFHEATEYPEFTEEPSEGPEPEVPEEPETEEPAVEPTNEHEIEEEEGEKEIDDEEDVLGDEEDDDDEVEEPVQQVEVDDDDDDDNNESTETPSVAPENEMQVPEVVEVVNRVEEEQEIMPKWLNKRQKKLRKLWEKYTLSNSERVLKKIRKLQVSLAQKTQE